MDAINLFLLTFGVVFIGELGDKSQAITFFAALTNRSKRYVVFFATALALTFVSGTTIYLTGFIPRSWLSTIVTIGGIGLIGYGLFILYTLYQVDTGDDGGAPDFNENYWPLFSRQFALVTVGELGDKTQFASFGIAIANPDERFIVFAGSALALTTAAAFAVLATKLVPLSWNLYIQGIGALLLIGFGGFMLIA